MLDRTAAPQHERSAGGSRRRQHAIAPTSTVEIARLRKYRISDRRRDAKSINTMTRRYDHAPPDGIAITGLDAGLQISPDGTDQAIDFFRGVVEVRRGAQAAAVAAAAPGGADPVLFI